MIEIKNLSKEFQTADGTVEALKDVSLTIHDGDIYGIIGMSGAGKSTLVRCINMLERPTGGQVLIDGQDIGALSKMELRKIRREITMIFQGFNLIPGLTALENVELPLIYRGMPKKERLELCVQSLAEVGLEHRMDHRPTELSGGQQQRVAIARAIAAKPPIIMADEPTGNLDTKAGADIMQKLISLNDNGSTVIIITHDLYLAKAAKRIITIQDGKIIGDREVSQQERDEVLNGGDGV